MTRNLSRLFAPVLTAALLSGCLSTPTVSPTRYFTLTPAVPVIDAQTTDKSLGIRPLLAAMPYDLEIAYLQEPNRLAYFARAEWAELPATTVNRALVDGLRGAGLFLDVGDAADMTRPECLMTGELRRFDADFTGDAPVAVVEVSLAIREAGGTGNIWEAVIRADVPLESVIPQVATDDALADLAAAMSEGITEVVEQVCSGVAESTAG